MQTSGISCREIVKSYPVIIVRRVMTVMFYVAISASLRVKRSNPSIPAQKHALLRCARNDGFPSTAALGQNRLLRNLDPFKP